MKTYSLFLSVIFIMLIHCKSISQNIEYVQSIVLDSYSFTQKPDATPFYKDKWRKVLAINAGKFKNKFASAITTFQGKKGKYQMKLTTLTETDGESTYKILINNKLIAEFQNPESEKDFQEHIFDFKKVKLKKGAVIEVQFNSHSNGKIPEGNAFAFSRGRWKQIEFIPIK